MATMIIDDKSPSFTFINVWKTASKENQKRLIQEMKAEFGQIQRKTGFVAMAIHASHDGKEVVVYAQWRSEEDFQKGVSEDPQVMEGRKKLMQFGEPSANNYQVDAIFMSVS